jgi:hypothetical protein
MASLTSKALKIWTSIDRSLRSFNSQEIKETLRLIPQYCEECPAEVLVDAILLRLADMFHLRQVTILWDI